MILEMQAPAPFLGIISSGPYITPCQGPEWCDHLSIHPLSLPDKGGKAEKNNLSAFLLADKRALNIVFLQSLRSHAPPPPQAVFQNSRSLPTLLSSLSLHQVLESDNVFQVSI